ncbi:MAG: hypothetical protein IKJ15_07995 [Lachnospiraceae bacterium]|nr:hypothetical protein [Lachnospiraceae bacterium]
MKKEKVKVKKPFYKSPLKIILLCIPVLVIVFLASVYIPQIIESIRLNSLDKFDVIKNMDRDSFAASGKGYIFNSKDADGNVIRLYGENISLEDNGIYMEPGGFIWSLDSVGAIDTYHPVIVENSSEDNSASWGGGYTFSDKTKVDNYKELIPLTGLSMHAFNLKGKHNAEVGEKLYPNFLFFRNDEFSPASFVLSELTVYCDSDKKTSKMGTLELDTDYYGYQFEGYAYDAGQEGVVDVERGIFTFYLNASPDNGMKYGGLEKPFPINCLDKGQFTVGELRDKEGNIVDKQTAIVEDGFTLDITVGDYTMAVELPSVPRFTGANVMHDLVPYAFPEAIGEINVLAVPVCWADQTHMASEETLELYRKNLGRIEDLSGNVKDYSDLNDTEFSFSEYFDVASYGKLKINTVLTDWYMSKENFADVEYNLPTLEYGEEILNWMKKTYPDMDWSKYDKDGNGYVDSLILINAGEGNPDEYAIISMGGAIHYMELYNGANAGTQKDPTVNCYVTINQRFLENEGARVLIHEFSHNLGLIDYYDVFYTGVNAVGGYDMQSDNHGDWNSYSKYAVGWLEPEVVTNLESGESVEIVIGSSALTADAIVIPAAGSKSYDKTPFNEYIMIDLFTDKGTHEFDAQTKGLGGVTGVRIYHVNALMECHTENAEGVSYDIGTIHYANGYSQEGCYNVELIQSGGENTFTDYKKMEQGLINPNVSAEDFFYAGDTFTVKDYDNFFIDGLMDDGSEFGYKVEVVSIDEGNDGPTACIRITAE